MYRNLQRCGVLAMWRTSEKLARQASVKGSTRLEDQFLVRMTEAAHCFSSQQPRDMNITRRDLCNVRAVQG
jgi:hypothetical protein